MPDSRSPRRADGVDVRSISGGGPEAEKAGKVAVVLGGGVGGLTAANALRGLLGREHRVILVERRRDHLFAPSFLWLMVGDRSREQVARDLRSLLRTGVELVEAEVNRLDPERRTLTAGERELSYDALVIALGADLAPEAFPGYVEAAHNFFDRDGAARLAETLGGFDGGRVVVAVTTLPYKCPAAPYEAALLVEAALRRRGVRDRSEVAIFTPEPQPMPVAGPVLGAAVSALLAERNVALHTARPVTAVDPGNESGWIPVDARTMRTRFPDSYAIGDVTTITLANGKPLPKAGVFAHGEALVVAREIAASFTGRSAPGFDGAGYCWVELGGGRAAFAEGDFYASPAPAIRLRAPSAAWHLGKVAFERAWMGRGVERAVAQTLLRVGSAVLRIKASP